MLKRLSMLLGLFAALAIVSNSTAEEKAVKKLLMITDSGGFVHDSVGLAEKVIKEQGPKYGYEVTCFRYTRDPEAKGTFKKKVDGKEVSETRNVLEAYAEDFRKKTGFPVEKEHLGRVNKETLAKFDAILFFTTGNPLTKDETKDLVEWVKAGHAYTGTHCASDTLYQEPEYGALVGGYFDLHPWTANTKINMIIESPNHPAAKPFAGNTIITDEIYQFKTPYSRDKLHIILKLDNASAKMDLKEIKREDKDFAIAWCHEFGKGRSFYTSLGHRKDVWTDERFQKHYFAGLDWATRKIADEFPPSNKK